ncbi:uncharacterized protein LOC124437344 isoform X2 [Xenia sp. Carnegie-2017]|nr:uncharacterized protein LOC124437344 isoform X2 [Xenia sp. Carnegie-2017]
MFSHAAMVRFDDNIIPAVHVIPVQAQNLFANGPNNCETVYKQDSPSGSHAENFKVLAERNGIKVVDPEVYPKIENGLNETSVVTPNLSADAAEFVPRFPASSSEEKLFDMVQQLLEEQKLQAQILQDCINNQKESETKNASLHKEKSMLQKAFKAATDELRKCQERNTMLSKEVDGLTDRLLESEQTNARLKKQVEALLEKVKWNKAAFESDEVMMSSSSKKMKDVNSGKQMIIEEDYETNAEEKHSSSSIPNRNETERGTIMDTLDDVISDSNIENECSNWTVAKRKIKGCTASIPHKDEERNVLQSIKQSNINNMARTKDDSSPFVLLMNKLSQTFPSKTREELVELLKIAKVTFGDKGFRGKKIEEIVKRVKKITV